MRIIKIQTPSNEKLNINLSGDEGELRELLSVLIGLNPSDIKGLRDKYGNYYTLSYAVGDKNFNSELSDIFYLVCVGLRDKSNTLPVSNETDLSFVEKNELMYNTINNNEITTNSVRKRKKSVGHNNEIFSKRKSLEEENERFFLLVNELTEKNFLDENCGSKIKNMIVEDNEQIILIFRNYIKNITDFKTFLSSLIRILNLNSLNNDKNRPNSPTNFTFNLMDYIEKLYPQYFNDLNDIYLLKNNIDNEFIIGAFEVFQSDFDFENFEDSLRRFLNRLKKPTPQSTLNNLNNIIPISNNNNLMKTNSNNSNLSQNILNNNFRVNNQQIVEDENKKLNDSKKMYESLSFSNKSPKKVNENTLKIIFKNLHRDQKAIFNYSLSKNFNEIEVFAHYYETLGDENLLIRSIKIYCYKFLNDFILKDFKDTERQTVKNLLKKRDKNILKLFTLFNDHKDLKRLIDDIHKLLSKLSELKTSSDSEPGSDFSLDKKQAIDAQNETVLDENTSYQINDFLEMIKKVTFLTEEEKIELIKRFKKKEPQAMNILNQYLKGRNISILKSNLINLMRNNNVSINNSSRVSPDKKKKQEEVGGNRINLKSKSEIIHQMSNISHNNQLALRTNSSTAMFNRDQSPAGLAEFEKLLNDLMDQGEISRHQAKFVIQRFVSSDEFIQSTWEAYNFNKNIEEFIESIRISSGNLAKRQNTSNMRGKTPAQLARKKREIIKFLESKESQEKQEIKKKQKHVIEILLNEDLLNKDIMPLINEMIENENNLLISALEIFSVTKDHWDFCETLDLIYAIFRNNKGDGGSEKKNSMDSDTLDKQISHLSSQNNMTENDLKMIQILNNFMYKKTNFSEKEKRIIQDKYRSKDNFLLSSLEFYINNDDEQEFLESLEMLRKNNHK